MRAVLDTTKYVRGGATQHWDVLNFEEVAKRKHIHNWKVNAHYHDDLFQIFFLATGSARLVVDGREVSLESPAIVTIPQYSVHAFEYEKDLLAYVITMSMAQMRETLQSDPAIFHALNQLHLLKPEGTNSGLGQIQALFNQIAEANTCTKRTRSMKLRNLLALLLLEIYDSSSPAVDVPAHGHSRGLKIVHLFRDLIEQNYHQHLPLKEYARQLAVTPTHLTRVSKQYCGQSASGLIQQRLLLEAKRRLIFSDRPISEISHELGFTSATYFSRFFQKHFLCSPSKFRKQYVANETGAEPLS